MSSSGTTRKERPEAAGPRLRPSRVQLRFGTELPLEQYIAQQAWRQATLASCPLHPEGECGLMRWGTYVRKYPVAVAVARWYCPLGRTTFSLLPDCLCASLPGTLEEVERVVTEAQQAEHLEPVADKIRPVALEGAESVGPAEIVQWIKRRVRAVEGVLTTIAGIFPEVFAGCEATILSFRERLGCESVLMALREIAQAHLQVLRGPVGLAPRWRWPLADGKRYQQSMRFRP